MVPLTGVISSLVGRCDSIVSVILPVGTDELWSIAGQCSNRVLFVVDVDAAVPLHQQSLAFLSACLDYA